MHIGAKKVVVDLLKENAADHRLQIRQHHRQNQCLQYQKDHQNQQILVWVLVQLLVSLLVALLSLEALLVSLTIMAKTNLQVRLFRHVTFNLNRLILAPIVPMMSVRNPNLSDEPTNESSDKDVNIWGQNNPMYKGKKLPVRFT